MGYGVAYPGNGLDLNLLTVALTIIFSQDNTVASRTDGNQNRQRRDHRDGRVGLLLMWIWDTSALLTTHGSERQ